MAVKVFGIFVLSILCQILVASAHLDLQSTSKDDGARHTLRCPRRIYEAYLVGSKAYNDVVPGVSAYWKDMDSVDEICKKLHEDPEDVLECMKYGSKMAFNKYKSSFIALQDLRWKIFGAVYKILESCLF